MTKAMRTDSIEQATHRSWTEWLEFLSSIDAESMNHAELARHIAEHMKKDVVNPGWWAQMVAVAYEQHSGKRLPGQVADGTFQTSVSRSTRLGMQALMNAWKDFAKQDKKVQSLTATEVRESGTDKRLYWKTKAPGGSSIVVTAERKSDVSASLIVTCSAVASAEKNQSLKQQWSEILDRFVLTLKAD